mmetsp:Transcript_29952/g.58715  ORF Transcript_29952/g.58715 Transcript_29952/m.58715 type:complete len:257 (-) Transcript_29952:447-1217(-)
MGLTLGPVPQDDQQRDPLVLHPQLHHDRAVPDRHNRHDPHPHPQQGLRSLQRPGTDGRRTRRGDGLEIDPQRSVSPPCLWLDVRCSCRHRLPDLGYGVYDALVRVLGILVPSQPWGSDDCLPAALCVCGHACWLLLHPRLQDVQLAELEAQHSGHLSLLPRHRLRHLLPAQPGGVGRALLRSGPVRYSGRPAGAVVRDLRPSGVLRLLLRYETRRHRVPCARQQHPSPDAHRPPVLQPPCCSYSHRWCAPFRGSLD